MPKRPDISILIVYYKETKELLTCLTSIKNAQLKVSFEVIIVDNSQSQKLEKKLKKYVWVKYLKASENLGYGKGMNLAARQARGEFIFTLNPDTKIFSDTLPRLLNFVERKKAKVAAAPTLVDAKGNTFPFVGTHTLNPARGIFGLSFINKLFPNNPLTKSYLISTSDKKSAYEADVIPGIFLIKKVDFIKIGGFDEHFFLYFEDTDLCKRLKERGFSLFVLPESQIMHSGGAATSKDRNIKRIFAQSRFYYFRKHYGIVNAILVEVFARFSKDSALLLSILTVAALLRLWMIGEKMQFIGDFGWYFLSARDFLLSGRLPLLGIASSVPILHQGAIYTWMLAGALLLGNFNPVYGAYLSTFLGILAVLGTYLISKQWFGWRVGTIATALAATSPFIVIHDRMPFVTAGIFPLTLLIAWLAKKGVKSGRVVLFCLGLAIAILFQFELVGFILLPIIAMTYYWERVKVKWGELLTFGLGGVVGLTPFIVSDSRAGVYIQTVGFVFWFIRKTLRGILFFTQGVNTQIFSSGLAYLSDIVFAKSTSFSLVFFTLAAAYFVYYFAIQRRKLSFDAKLILVWLTVAFLGFFTKGVYSEAYMPIVFFPSLLILAFFLNFLISKFRYVGWATLYIIIGVNSVFLVKKDFNASAKYSVSKMNEVAKFIVREAAGADYQLIYRGPADMYESGDNAFRYLLWLQGSEPQVRAPLKYTVSYEGLGDTSLFDKTTKFGDISVGVKLK